MSSTKSKQEIDREVGHYVVTAHRPSSVSHAVQCSFLTSDSECLVLAKSLRLEVWETSVADKDIEDGPKMEKKLDIPIRGRIVTLCAYRPRVLDPRSINPNGVDYLLYTTERKRYAIIAYNPVTKEIETKAYGSFRDSVGREKSGAPICIVDPSARIAIVQFYDGFLKIIPFCPRSGVIRDLDAFNVRLVENSALSMCFLNKDESTTGQRKADDSSEQNNAVIALLYQDADNAFRATTYTIDFTTKDLTEGPWTLRYENIDAFSSIIIPHSNSSNGAIIVGHKHITYYNGRSSKSIPMEDKIVLCYDQVDTNRYLLGDERGSLWLLTINQDDNGMRYVSGMTLERMGDIHLPATVSYLGEGVCFIGTQYGDSQLIQLSEQVDIETNSFIAASTEYTALGPILDFDTVTSNQQQAIVTCSGMGKDGTLRIVRNGIGIHEQADVEISGITSLFSLHLPGQQYDKYLVQSFIHATRILSITGEEMAEDTIPGFDSDETTLYAGNIKDLLLQITPRKVVLVKYLSGNSFHTVAEWTSSDANITVANANNHGQVLVALRGGVIVSLLCNESGIEEIGKVDLGEEVSCINIDSFTSRVETNKESSMEIDMNNIASQPESKGSRFAAIGMWDDLTVRIVALQTLAQVCEIRLGTDTQARSLALTAFHTNQCILFVGLGDGQLITYQMNVSNNNDEVSVCNRKKVSLGTQAIALNTFYSSEGKLCIFAASDRPSVVYSSNGKIAYSNVNFSGDVTYACSFNCELFPDCLALALNDSLMIGTIDEFQKLHVQTFHLGETPHRIAYHEAGKMFCVGCVASEASGGIETNFIKFIDEGTFDELEKIDLDPYEMVLSIISCNLGGASVGDRGDCVKPYVVVGTAYAYPDEDEPARGRILIFECRRPDEAKMSTSISFKPVRQITEEHASGGVYSLCSFKGNCLYATINSRLKLYVFKEQDDLGQLKAVSSHHGHILSLFVKSKDDHAIVGDLMRSISVYNYSSSSDDGLTGIEEIARDFNANWTTSCEILSSNVYLGAENWNNIYSLRRNVDATSEEARCRLETQGMYYLGEMVNKFARGSLVMTPPSSDNALDDQGILGGTGSSTLYATVDGSIGVIMGLDKTNFLFFRCLEKAMSKVAPVIGGVTHEEFRSFEAEKRLHPSVNFIDGDLVESFLDLAKDEMLAVVEHMNSDGTWESPDENSLVLGDEDDKMATLTVDDVLVRVEEISRLH